MRPSYFVLLFAFGLGACGDSNGPGGMAFTASVKKQGGSTTEMGGDSTLFDLSCTQTDTLCNHLAIAFYASNNIAGFKAPTVIWLTANNVPAQNLLIKRGTYPFDDVTPFDIFAEIDTGDGYFWVNRPGGTLTITESDADHIGGHFKTDMDQPGRPEWGLPVLKVNLDFNIPTH